MDILKLRMIKLLKLMNIGGDDGPAPQWRMNKHIGRPIKKEGYK